MPLNIPLPSAPGEALAKGINSGGVLFSRIMQPIIAREKQKQEAEQFKEKQKQLESHFQQNFGLNKQNAARLAQAAADNHKIALNKLDPTWGIKELYELANNAQNNTQGLNNNKELNSNNNNALRDKLSSIGMFGQDKEMSQGQGVFPSENQEENPSYPVENNSSQNPVNSKPNLMQMIVGGVLKKKTGVNPFAPVPQTPDEKQAAAIDLFKQKEEIKSENKGGDNPTNTVLTQNQQAIQGIDSSLPIIDELINDKNLPGITSFSPGNKAKYIAKTGGVIDTLVAAQNLPKVQASIDLVEQQIRRHTGETVKDYQDRLKDFKKDLIKRRERAQSVLKNRKVNTELPIDFSKISDDELRKIAGGG